jgi:Fe-S cluster assembly protein SufD
LPLLPDNSPHRRKDLSEKQSAFGYNRGNSRTYTAISPELQRSGVIFKDLYQACLENGKYTENHLGSLIGPDFGKFEALNFAIWNNGLFLYIPPGVVIEKPIYLRRYPTGKITVSRILVMVDNNAEATIIDDYSGQCEGECSQLNCAVEIMAGDAVNLRYVNLQRFPSEMKSYITIRSRIGRETNIKSIFGSIGGAATKVNAGTILTGPGANSEMYGIIFGEKKQHFDYHTMQHHKASDSFSNLNIKVVLKDKANSAYTGLIKIEKDTANCEAYQENRNLLLNPGAKAESIPELEILTDQVRCTHGATMGPIDPEQIFYLKCRGIKETEAVKMLVTGFAESLLGQLPQDIAGMLRDLIHVKMEGSVNGGNI